MHHTFVHSALNSLNYKTSSYCISVQRRGRYAAAAAAVAATAVPPPRCRCCCILTISRCAALKHSSLELTARRLLCTSPSQLRALVKAAAAGADFEQPWASSSSSSSGGGRTSSSSNDGSGNGGGAATAEELLSSWDYRAAFGSDADSGWDVLPPLPPAQPQRRRDASDAPAAASEPAAAPAPPSPAAAPSPTAAAAPAQDEAAQQPTSGSRSSDDEERDLSDDAIPPADVWRGELRRFEGILDDPSRPWALRLVLRLAYCRNGAKTRAAYRSLRPDALARHLSQRYAAERGAAAAVRDALAARRRIEAMRAALTGGPGARRRQNGGMRGRGRAAGRGGRGGSGNGGSSSGNGVPTEAEVQAEREQLALARERAKSAAFKLASARQFAAARGDAHYTRAAARLEDLLEATRGAAAELMRAQLRALNAALTAAAAAGGVHSDAGREAAAARLPPLPRFDDLIADYRRAALEFDCYRDRAVFDPSAPGARFFELAAPQDGDSDGSGGSSGAANDGGGAGSETAGQGPAAVWQARAERGGKSAMLGNAPFAVRPMRLPLLRPRPSALATYALEWRRQQREQQQQQQQQQDSPRNVAASSSSSSSSTRPRPPTVEELAETTLAPGPPPPLAVLLRRAAALDGELLSGRLRGVLQEQRAAAEMAGELDAAVRWGGGGRGARGRRPVDDDSGSGASTPEEDEGDGEDEGSGGVW